jgi:hypothetical protein
MHLTHTAPYKGLIEANGALGREGARGRLSTQPKHRASSTIAS